ncbi:CDP-glucose 4,6-dehydratase [Noviherbaspirillum sp. ST9]|uniref:CDP-glucose 4,6-dehydratase n=1 Tax=Noviherbaspirillum sp. ST9 TaxID=3401606 RepID=UPI003B588633
MVTTDIHDLATAFRGRKVFLTGHTGFKGAWLALWLKRLGAEVTGYALAPNSEPSLFEVAGIRNTLARHVVADIRSLADVTTAMRTAAPDVVFHLAAQPLVRASYRDPVETWSTNVIGTVHLLEAVRSCPSVRAVVVVTTDKCYQNLERDVAFAETDPLGGNDPYSASKAGAELVVQSYRKSFFANGPLVGSARAGNVIGGGDWCEDRLIPDAARATAAGNPLLIRNPNATRPWQHVLEALHGYLLLASRLLAGDAAFADAFNFGPNASDNIAVGDVLSRMQQHWPELHWQLDPQSAHAPHEARLLCLDASKAQRMLGWTPRWDLDTGLKKTAAWYREVLRNPGIARALTEQQLDEFAA